MNAYLIIGDPNTHKSSLLRSLTGCFNRNDRDIQLVNGTSISIYARVSSLQESKITPKDFIDEVYKRGCTNVIFCLQPDPNPLFPMLYPDAHAYIAAFEEAGWSFVKTAVVGIHLISPVLQHVARFPRAASLPINVLARNIRAHFEWQ